MQSPQSIFHLCIYTAAAAVLMSIVLFAKLIRFHQKYAQNNPYEEESLLKRRPNH